MSHHFGLAVAMASLFAGTACAQAQTNLITNGTFENGLVGYEGDYTIPTNPSCQYGSAVYCQQPESTVFVNTNPNLDHPSWASFGAFGGNVDAGGTFSPNMLVVNGGSDASRTVWRQTGITVTPFETYQFTGWAASNYAVNDGLLQALFNTAPGGTPFDIQFINGANGPWQEFTFDWYSGASSTLDLALADLDTQPNGNDFSLDDLSLTQTSVPEPASVAALIVGLTVIGIIRRRRRS